MQHDLDTIRAAKATERREMAINLYDMACDAPEGADWQEVAEALRLCIPNARKTKAAEPVELAEVSGFAPYYSATVNYKPSMRDVESARFEIAFADGPTIRASGWRDKKGRWNVGQAVRAAVELFRYKVCPGFAVSHVEVPEIVAIRNTLTGEEYDPAPANAETVEKRRAIVKRPRTTPEQQLIAVWDRLYWFDDAGKEFESKLLDRRRTHRLAELESVWPPIPLHPERVKVEAALEWFDMAGQGFDAFEIEARRKDCKAVWPAIRKPRVVKTEEPTAPTPAPAWKPSARFLSSTAAIRVAA